MGDARYTPVLIAGAGPTGLTLAIDLARHGVACRLIDGAQRICPGSRGKGLQPRTQEVFEDLGVLDAVRTAGSTYPTIRAYTGRTVVWEGTMTEITEPTPDVPYPNVWMIPQWRTERILRDRLAELGGAVERGTTLRAFTTDADADGVTATLTGPDGEQAVRADYLVGADGGGSTVRQTLGVGFDGETYDEHRALFGDVRVQGLDHDYWHTWATAADRSDMFGLCPLPGTDTFQLMAAEPGGDFDDSPAALQELITTRTGVPDVRLTEITWLSHYRANMRMAQQFRVGGVFLVGDAAHVHSPAGGQGLNTSVQDAYNLGWKLAAVLGGAHETLLDSYDTERAPIAAQVLGISTRLHYREATPSGLGTPQRGRDTQQLDLTYRDGPLTRDTRAVPGPVRAGDRAPDAPLRRADGTRTRLFDVLRGPHFTLLAFGADAALTATPLDPSGAEGTAVALDDADGYARKAFGIDGPAHVLIRPDGYLALLADTPADVHAYLREVIHPGGRAPTS